MKVKVDLNIWPEQSAAAHGEHKKIGMLLHETVSGQIMNSLADVRSISRYVASEGYGIHGITDGDGYKAWVKGHGEAILYHASSLGTKHNGRANTNYMGIEQVSRVMLDYKTNSQRLKAWLENQTELDATAQLIAAAARAHGFPIVDNPGDTTKPGITTHYEVTMYNGVTGGHTDCWPSHMGGYYPKHLVIALAQHYYELGYRF